MANPILSNEKSARSLSEFEFLHEPSDKNSKLGVGSFASVKLAKEKKTGKQYAIKIIDMEPSKITQSDLHNIKVEICIHRKIDHPNIIKFYDYIQKDSKMYFILDFAENGNLYSYIHKRKSLQPEEIFRFFHQTCLAFNYLHQNDILHRDLKPENLLLDKERNVKLCDFGWSTKKIHEKRTTFCGTYEYMAPEIVNKKTYDYRVDIWALGVLLYELIHREAPYKGRSLPEISKSQSKSQITFGSHCPSGAKDLIQKILRHNPEERISMAQILAHPWVKSHLPAEEEDSLQVEEYEVSPVEEIVKAQVKRAHENFKSEIIVSGNTELLLDVSGSQTRKHANTNSFVSLKSKIRSDSKENEREKPKDRIKERLNLKDAINTVSATLTSVETQRRTPLGSYPLKTYEENLSTSRGHAKSSSVINNILTKFEIEEKNNSNNIIKKKKAFDSSILSPTLKNKVDRIINQLAANTTTHRSESISGVFTAKNLNRNSQVATAAPTEALLSCKPQSEIRSILSTRNQPGFKIITSNKADENSYSHILSSSNTCRSKSDLESIKLGLQKKLTLPKNDSFHNISSQFYGRNLTTRTKFDSRTPDLFDFDKNSISTYKISGLETTKASSKNSMNVLSMADQNKYRVQEEVGLSLNKVYKGDYRRRQGLKTAEELHPSTLQFSSLSERRNENNKENTKKDIIRDKELQRIREEYIGKYAF